MPVKEGNEVGERKRGDKICLEQGRGGKWGKNRVCVCVRKGIET